MYYLLQKLKRKGQPDRGLKRKFKRPCIDLYVAFIFKYTRANIYLSYPPLQFPDAGT